MNVKTARAAIEAILAAIPDEELPDFDRIEHSPADDRGQRWEWCGGEPGTWAWRVTAVHGVEPNP